MSRYKESISERRKKLSEEIGRQRTELAVAYHGLIKPFQYADTGIAALKTLRKNGWLIAMAPSVVSLVYSFFGWKKVETPGLLGRLRRKVKLKNADAEEEEKEVATKLKKPMARWAGRAWSAFQVYRRVRPFLPFP